jgi:hypothetical protein
LVLIGLAVVNFSPQNQYLMSSEWYHVKVRFLQQMGDGQAKQTKTELLIDASTFGDAEEKAFKALEGFRDIFVDAVGKSNILELVKVGDTDIWFKCKVVFVVADEVTEKEKKVTTYILVEASDSKEAYERCCIHLKDSLSPFTIPKVEETKITEIVKEPKAATVGSDPKSDARIESKIGFTKQDLEAIKLTAQLIERREEVKLILGDEYAEMIARNVPVIQAEMELSGHNSPIKAVIAIGNERSTTELYGSILLACAADMMEGKIKPIDAKGGDNDN